MKRAFSSDPRVEQSLRHSVRDGVAYSVMSGVGETYFAAYALFLGATAAQVSLLAAVPPLFGALMQLFAAWLEGRVGSRRTLILSGAFMHALTWFPIIWLPYFFPGQAIAVMVSCIVLYYGWIGLGSPLWCSLMAELVPSRKRGRYFGGRTQLMSISSFAGLIAGGLALEFFEMHDNARLGFMVIFTVAAVARLYSVYHLARMHEPQAGDRRAPTHPALPPHAQVSRARFVRFSLFVGAVSFAVSVAGPFFTVYMLKDLKFSYFQFTVATAVTVLAQFLTLRNWGRLSDVFGNRSVIAATAMIVPFVPVLWLLSDNFFWVLFIQALAGWSWAGFGLATGNYLYDVVAPHRRTLYWAIHNVMTGVGTCVGALLGGVMSELFPHTFTLLGHEFNWASGLWGLMVCSALLRVAVMMAFLPGIQEVRTLRPLPARAFVFRMLRFNRAAGFVLDRIGLGRRRTRPTRVAARPDTTRA
jgi:MFS family permease